MDPTHTRARTYDLIRIRSAVDVRLHLPSILFNIISRQTKPSTTTLHCIEPLLSAGFSASIFVGYSGSL